MLASARPCRRPTPWLAALLGALLLCLTPLARAATFTVTTTGDSPADPTTLRAAINAVQASTAVSDTITVATTGTISLVNGEMALSNPNGIAGKTVTIAGPGAQNLTITGNRNTGTNTTRVFHFGGLAVNVSGLTITQGLAGDGKSGGGVLVEGAGTSVGLTNCAVTTCTPSALGNVGGALALTGCVVSNSLSSSGGAGISSSGGSLILSGCTVNNNFVFPGEGGGIASTNEILILTNCAVTANNAFGNGGGIFSSGDVLTITNSNVSNNETGQGHGGGLYVLGSVSNTASVRACTFAGNLTGQNSGSSNNAGGGVYNEGDALTMTNCTVSGNQANGPGGGVYNINGGLTLQDCTLASNTPGGLDNETGGAAAITATIITGSSVGNPNVVNNGMITSGGSNLIGDPDGNGFVNDPNHADPNSQGNHDQTGVANPLLGPLQDNGGPTPTQALQAGSLAIDADFADSTPTDQRAAPRPFGPRNDSGAFESGATAPPVPTNTHIVTNTNDSGAGSLRDAINTINTNPGGTVMFDPFVFGPGMPRTITLTSGALLIIQNMTITGPGAGLLSISGNHANAVFDLGGSATVAISGLTVRDGSVASNTIGGGIFVGARDTLTLTDSVVTGCNAPSGGGLGIVGGATLTNCVVSDNTATGDGGGIDLNTVTSGGILSLTMINCTVSGNTAGNNGGGTANPFGEAFFSDCTVSGNSATTGGGISNDVVTSLFTCTVTGNSATTGGGIFSTNALIINNSTVSANTAPTGSGIDSQTTNNTIVTATIVAGNTGSANIVNSGPITSGGSNLIGDPNGNGFTNGVVHDQTGVANPGLGPLRDNGGPTRTMALLAGSPAIDADFQGDTALDQRGVTRPVGPRNDIGAYEFGAPVAQNDAYTVQENTTLIVQAPGVLANDTGDGSGLTAVVQTQPAHGSLNLNGDGSFTYKPNTDFLGTDTFTYQAQNAGGQGGTATVTLTVANALPPTTTASLTGASFANGFFRGPVTVKLTASASPSTTFYRIDSGPQQTYGGPFTVSGDFAHLVTFYSTDNAGNAEGPAKSATFSIDSTPPVTTITGRAVPGGTEITLKDADNFSGPGGTFYRVDSGPQQTYSGPFVVGGPGQHLVTAYSMDRALNAEGPNKSLTVTNPGPPPPPDTTPPVTTPALSGPSYVNGFWRGPVTVTLTATDDRPGPLATFYRVDSGAQQTYTGPFTVSGDFRHLVTFYSTDRAGNAESPNGGATFSIDSTPPVTSFTGRPTPTGEEVTLTDRDNFSGPGGTFYRVDSGPQQTYSGPFTVPGNFTHLLTFYSLDRAGNAEGPARSATFTVNTDGATTTASLSGAPGLNGYFHGPVTVTLRASDSTGIVGTFYRVDSGPQQTYTAPFVVSGEFTHLVTFFSTDGAGVPEPSRSATFGIDSVAPGTTASPSGTRNADGTFRGPVSVSLFASDAVSGVSGTFYRVDSGPQQTYSGPFAVSGDFAHLVTFFSTDRAGNAESSRSSTFAIAPAPSPSPIKH